MMPFPFNENPYPPEVPHIGICPVCGAYLYGYEKVYVCGFQIVGCENCIEVKQAEDEF